ncbi:Zn-ribbon domain-containing OB-fold protein [Pollutimonas bauzanensis]|uniref:Zn-ribbon domain-containing OB-fold protein n=1 Tax=Pollutimonas bauzanensis TaxID=658167 RepID=A0A1M5UMM7_9BURK|nr:Zn-ribbon domain-containing OB-fold protein [Pollutimonas bauzanensis]SHH64282.1 hypothetical protein SAMN04488135_10447 [Pollutimonas bauzanensis]
MPDAKRPLPAPTRITQPFWDAARQGRLLIQRCKACGKLQFYPRLLCLACLSDDMDWQESHGRGTIYTFTINRRAASLHMSNKTPYAVAIIDLEEGVRMMGQVVTSDLSDLHIGAHVRVAFEVASPEISLPIFELLNGSKNK